LNDEDYQPPLALTAKLDRLTFKVDRPQLAAQAIKKLQNAEAVAVDGKPNHHMQAGPR